MSRKLPKVSRRIMGWVSRDRVPFQGSHGWATWRERPTLAPEGWWVSTTFRDRENFNVPNEIRDETLGPGRARRLNVTFTCPSESPYAPRGERVG